MPNIGFGSREAINSYVAGFFEQDYGVHPASLATGATFFPFQSCSFKIDYDQELFGELNYLSRNTRRVSERKYEGNLTFYPTTDNLGFMLALICGTVTSYDYGGVYSHIFSIVPESSASKKSVSFNIIKGGIIYTFTGGKATNFNLNVPSGDVALCSVDFIFKDATLSGSDISSYYNDSGTHIEELKGAVNVSEYIGMGYAEYKAHNLSFTIENKIKKLNELGQADLIGLRSETKNISFDGSVRFDTTTSLQSFIQKMSVNTGRSISIQLSNDTYEHYFSFDTVDSTLFYETPDPEISSPNDLLVSNFSAQSVLFSSVANTFTLNNKTPSY